MECLDHFGDAEDMGVGIDRGGCGVLGGWMGVESWWLGGRYLCELLSQHFPMIRLVWLWFPLQLLTKSKCKSSFICSY